MVRSEVSDGDAERLRELVGESEDAGLGLPEMIEVLKERARGDAVGLRRVGVTHSPAASIAPIGNRNMLSGSTTNSWRRMISSAHWGVAPIHMTMPKPRALS